MAHVLLIPGSCNEWTIFLVPTYSAQEHEATNLTCLEFVCLYFLSYCLSFTRIVFL